MSDKNEPTRQDELPPEAADATSTDAGDDTEGHSFMYEYGRTVARDRNAEAQRNARESRLRDDARNKNRR